MNISQGLPSAIDVERTVLGSMLVDKHAPGIAFEMLTENAFYSTANRRIFLCMKEMFNNKTAIDLITIPDTLRKKGWLDIDGNEAYLAELAESICTSANIGYYAGILLEKAARRKVIEACEELCHEAQSDEITTDAISEKLSTLVISIQKPRKVFDLAQWPLSRFSGDPEETRFLVSDLIPQGVAGTLYSAGGSGKSTLALDLSLRIAIAGNMPTPWLGKYAIPEGGKILYFSAEEPEAILHKRVRGLAETIAGETGSNVDTVMQNAEKNLSLINVWGSAEQLFDVKSNSIAPTQNYLRIYETVKCESIKLVVLDTRSRLSGAEGAGNAIVSQEVGYYEKLAADFGATILILHHTNKASYGGLVHAQAAQRGESAFTDCLRFGLYLQPMNEETAKNNDIAEADRPKYLTVTHAKSNYSPLQQPIILRREGWRFELMADMKPKMTLEDRKAKHSEEDIQIVVDAVRESPKINQRKLIQSIKKISKERVRRAIQNAEEADLIFSVEGERGALLYEATQSEDDDRSSFPGW